MILLSEILGSRLVDGAGKKLGRVMDVRFSGENAERLKAAFFLYGAEGFFARLGLEKRPIEKIPVERIGEIREGAIRIR